MSDADVTLDCSDFGTAVSSLAAGFGIEADAFREAAMADHDREPDFEPPLSDARAILRAVGGSATTARPFTHCMYFHATRTLDAQSIRSQGLRPLGDLLDLIWGQLRGFALPSRSKEAWNQLRRTIEEHPKTESLLGYHSRLQQSQHGPCGEVVRAVALGADVGPRYDYLACPEIVHDIAAAIRCEVDNDVAAEFAAAAVPVVVKFRTTISSGCLEAAVAYVRAELRGEPLPSVASSGGFDGQGQAVPAHEICSVEEIQPEQSTDNLRGAP